MIQLSVANYIPNLYLKQIYSGVPKYVKVNALSLNLGEEMSAAVFGYRTFTGCDSVSSFVGRGKISSL